MKEKVDLDKVIFGINHNMSLKTLMRIRTYIPFEEKIELIEGLMKELFFINEDNVLTYNSIDKYFKFIMLIFKTYTNIDLKGTYDEYNKIVTNGLFNIILTEIKSDYDDFQDLMNMRFNDYIRESYK